MKPGGRLVYATCSLLREENDDVVAEFLQQQQEFSVLPAGDILARRNVAVALTDDALRLTPQHHHTDGFYALVMERKK